MNKSQNMLEKWGGPVVERGFTQVPNILLQVNMFVHDDHKLSSTELLVLLLLVAAWWEKDEMPYPSMRTLADRSGISERQVQRAIKTMEEKGYLVKFKKKLRNTVVASNGYDLNPTVKILNDIASHYNNKAPREIHAEKDLSKAKVGQTWVDGDGLDWEIFENKGDFLLVTPSFAEGEPRRRDSKTVSHRARGWYRKDN